MSIGETVKVTGFINSEVELKKAWLGSSFLINLERKMRWSRLSMRLVRLAVHYGDDPGAGLALFFIILKYFTGKYK